MAWGGAATCDLPPRRPDPALPVRHRRPSPTPHTPEQPHQQPPVHSQAQGQGDGGIDGQIKSLVDKNHQGERTHQSGGLYEPILIQGILHGGV